MALTAYAKVVLTIALVVAAQAAAAEDERSLKGDRLAGTPDPTNWTVDFVRKVGYSIESHTVTTADGFILTLNRIPANKEGSNKGGPPVLLHHGFLGSAADWVVLGPGKALGFILADRGFDVWLANARGSTTSRHTSRPKVMKSFWNWSFHEIGTHDIPAEINYILQKTGRESLSFVGFSTGATSFLSMSAANPEYVKKVNRMVALGPLAYMQHTKVPVLKWVAPLTSKVTTMVTYFGGDGELIPTDRFRNFTAQHFCKEDPMSQKLCSNLLFLLFGFSADRVDSTVLEKIFEFSPAGGSLRTLTHVSQLMKRDPVFGEFDFGKDKNTLVYGSGRPPTYDLSAVTIPVHVLMAENDQLANKTDVDRLISELPPSVFVKVLTSENFNHFDFVYGDNAAQLFYGDVVDILDADKNKK